MVSEVDITVYTEGMLTSQENALFSKFMNACRFFSQDIAEPEQKAFECVPGSRQIMRKRKFWSNGFRNAKYDDFTLIADNGSKFDKI